MNKDKLQAEFTNWLETVAFRTKTHYIRDNKKHNSVCSIDEVSEDKLLVEPADMFIDSKDFDFENTWLRVAFSKLSVQRQLVLKMLYIEDKTPMEIAKVMNCTVQRVYQYRSSALEYLKKAKEDQV